MPAFITTDELESLQTNRDSVPSLEREDPQAVRIIVVPAPGSDHGTVHRSTTHMPIDLVDDLQLATWEDAEWR